MPIVKSDFLVLGSGIAGLSFALKVAEHGKVNIVTKSEPRESNTRYAQGGVAGVWDKSDDVELHYKDTLIAGAGLCHPDAVKVLVQEGPDRLQELIDMGCNFDQNEDGSYNLAKEGGHSRHRILHCADLTGAEVERALLERAEAHPNITIFDHHMGVDLITEHHVLGNLRADFNMCFGAYILDINSRRVLPFQADFTMLATGGASQAYQHTTNPEVATGDGLAMAYRAGVRIANMEFIQFHPTCLYNPGKKPFLITEAMRGHGAYLVNERGERFMHKYDERLELAPRDIVARAIDTEMKQLRSECVFLDVSHIEKEDLLKHFPNIYQHCKKHLKIDIAHDRIPVTPAAHYVCGGVMTNLNALTSMQNLYAAGETAHSGIHGGNRLASNSLLEALVFTHRAAEKIISKRLKNRRDFSNIVIPSWDDSGAKNKEEWFLIRSNLSQIKHVMWDYVGIVRSTIHLKSAYKRMSVYLKEIEDYYKRTRISPELLQLRNCAAVGDMIIQSALRRHESRGAHYMTDYPSTRESCKKDTIIVGKI
ncbi:L-aspartate oxidase [Persicobacter psychrovividus]|uniref:L-aspartate oxidase n=1 Tax=Persicobacter psychrovividus TaxID=387638 RepID=A0ABM7VB86_9BACT|nr:L-aspartate oxidase [Persicobacter psychrovividus]